MQDTFHSILFDFDYTLADSSKGVVECVNYALGNLGLSPAEPEAICRTIGKSLPLTFAKLTGDDNYDKIQEFIRLFVKRADEVMAAQTALFPDVPASIRRLKRKNLQLGIVSTKYRYRIEDILRRERLLEFFQVIIGGEDVAEHKPDPTGLKIAFERLGSSPAQVLYVGDSLVDAETARRGGVAFAAVLSGTAEKADFGNIPAMHIADDIKEMADWILG
jgi:phosphoglycolate phosphatase